MSRHFHPQHSEERHGRRFARDMDDGHRHPRDRHGEGRGGRRPGRVFDHGELRLVVLALIAERPRHGYELIKAIEDRLAGSYSPSPGVIYPTLTLLEELGHATVEEAGGKKLYALTEDGAAWMAANKPAIDAAMARMGEISANHGGGPAPQLIRAMENLKLALRLRQAAAAHRKTNCAASPTPWTARPSRSKGAEDVSMSRGGAASRPERLWR